MNIIINSKIKSKYQQKEIILKLKNIYCKYKCLHFEIINNNNF